MSKIKEEIVKSESAHRLMSYVLPVYDNDPYMLHIFEAIGKEWDQVVNWVEDIENQPYPQFATFTLPLWEESIGLETDDRLTDDQRRKRIITKMSTFNPMTRNRVEEVASSTVGYPVEINDLIGSYTFDIYLNPSLTDIRELIPVINEIKPAHLSYYFSTDRYRARSYRRGIKENVLQLVSGTSKAGLFPRLNAIGNLLSKSLVVKSDMIIGTGIWQRSAGLRSGRKNVQTAFGQLSKKEIKTTDKYVHGFSDHFVSGSNKSGAIYHDSHGSIEKNNISTSEEKLTGIGGLLKTGRLNSGSDDEPSVFGKVSKTKVEINKKNKTGVFEVPSGRYKAGELSFSSNGTAYKSEVAPLSKLETGIGSSFPCGSRSSGEGVA